MAAEKKKIKVLIVDDSRLQREALSRGLSDAPDIEVVAKASDAFDARDRIIEFRPDVMTCDIQMPKMNGIEFIKRLIPQYRIPVIVISSVSEAVFEALNAGAVDFIAKPAALSGQDMAGFVGEVKKKIRIAVNATVQRTAITSAPSVTKIEQRPAENKKIIAIGASTGGTEAIFSLLKELPPDIPGIVIVQHIPPVFSAMFAERLNRQTGLNVREAQTGDRVMRGHVLIAPGNAHMTLTRTGGIYKVQCSEGDKVSGHCPSVDVLFASVAKAAGENAVGVLLTGMGSDGAKGLLEMRRAGARTIGQNERSCVVYGMPRIAYNIGAVQTQVSLSDMPALLSSLA